MRRCLSVARVFFQSAALRRQHRVASCRVPPPLPGARSALLRGGPGGKLPPPPPLPGAVVSGGSALPWKSPQEVLATFVEYIPTFYVPVHCVAAILSEDCRTHFIGRGRFTSFIKRYRFFFDVRVIDGVRADVKLRDDLNHPRRGAADKKFMMTDVGDVINYVAVPEYIVSLDSIEQSGGSVALKPACAPPAVHVRLEERVPVLERLKALVPESFTLLDQVEESVPEDVLFHPYFDCQGGLAAVASKFPEHFQVVDGMIRRRPPHLAPLALNDYTLEDSPIPEVAKMVREQVCGSDIPHWVSLTSLYEQLTREQKRQIKREFKSFAGFLRSHGKSLSLSHDMLQVARWIPQQERKALTSAVAAPGESASAVDHEVKTVDESTAADEGGSKASSLRPAMRVQYEYTHTQVINELFDTVPPNRTLNLTELLELVRPEMRPSLPKKILPWLASFPTYFVVDDPGEKDPAKARIRRASDRQPLDVALELYQRIPEEGITEEALVPKLPSVHRDYVKRVGLQHLVESLSDWLALTRSDEKGELLLKRLKTDVELERAICSKDLKTAGGNSSREYFSDVEEEEIEKRWPRLKYEGTMCQQKRPIPSQPHA
ncbi:hypothetical protein ERJ75_001241100 [Trypanosoma vivax]|uniref:Uncharacterized protein n=1 Tax=Trypanosoma vivax (strain Y486) TaxID=1055687 RepID=G0TWK5_TRYVY|nr:hypothetical protein TRVL_05858 [Trypanosoma vivax]KAH8608997.1 hypothetical protein ERJ75_001241100 [Trypanosoma vivax]CCC48343.1 conserved hypothetical protein [Trypanosoma vivax Y486]